MSKSQRLHAQGTDGLLAYEFTIHSAAAKESAHGSHVFVEFLQSLLSNADVGSWEKFETEVSPEMYFSAMLKSLAQAWVSQYWDSNDEDSKSLPLHRAIDEMLIHLNKTGHLPEKINSPWQDEDEDEDEDAAAESKSNSRN